MLDAYIDIQAPERTPAMVQLWQRHYSLVGSLRYNPLQNGEHHLAYRSGARDEVSYSNMQRYLRLGDDGPFELLRFDRSDWGDESKMIELSAEQVGFSLEAPDGSKVEVQHRAGERLAQLKQDAQPFSSNTNEYPENDKDVSASRNNANEHYKASSTDENVDWQRMQTEDGSLYYYSSQTGETVWKLPPGSHSASYNNDEVANREGVEWQKIDAEDGTVYFYSPTTGETVWELPPGAMFQPFYNE